MRSRLALAALLCTALFAVPLQSQSAAPTPPAPPPDTALDRRVRDLASLLRCPVCLNLSVQDSPSELARDMRDLIRERLARGETEQQVLGYFIQRYGEWVLMEPPAHGVSLLVWVLPVVAVAGGAALVIVAVRRWVRNPQAAGQEPVDDDYVRKVREELARRPRD
ncbi:MAG: cytochrome c-type biogenesis protein CcmH [Gemmatimonadetes bacterium]|nr:cytochrome c-type biogenesis protein CcmH [Gemmatimonadota bacterium]